MNEKFVSGAEKCPFRFNIYLLSRIDGFFYVNDIAGQVFC